LINLSIIPLYLSHIFIDESGQCTEAELWIPLGGLAKNSTSIILCGDPKQLGPVIMLDLSRELQQKLTSPLVRYMEMPCYKNDKRLSCQLVDCFRCHPKLVHIISDLFYEQKLFPVKNTDTSFKFNGMHLKEVRKSRFLITTHLGLSNFIHFYK
jgi:helicase MOV-10